MIDKILSINITETVTKSYSLVMLILVLLMLVLLVTLVIQHKQGLLSKEEICRLFNLESTYLDTKISFTKAKEILKYIYSCCYIYLVNEIYNTKKKTI